MHFTYIIHYANFQELLDTNEMDVSCVFLSYPLDSRFEYIRTLLTLFTGENIPMGKVYYLCRCYVAVFNSVETIYGNKAKKYCVKDIWGQCISQSS